MTGYPGSLDVVHGMHARYSVNIRRSVGYDS